ncbi:MAG: CPBP family intramembrane metalloprotease [Hyphomonadaceae bacterium]|nr:CPBP family intramembrane metalloprotease [Hyphomonadaceae bacterium]
MILGPYNAPLALASRPLMSLFWAVFAPTVAVYFLVGAVDAFTGNWASDQFRVGGDAPTRFILLSLAGFPVFVLMTLWSERIGAGPFGGPIRSSGDWIAIGAVTGPVVLNLSVALMASLFSDGDPNWAYRDSVDPALLQMDAVSLAMVAFVVLLTPLIEEVGFRGFGMGCLLARGWHPVLANIAAAAAFTAIHQAYTLPALVPVFIMGLYLGALRVISQSMAAPIAAHISANAVSMLVFAISVS